MSVSRNALLLYMKTRWVC